MFTSKADLAVGKAANVLIPLIRTAATIGFAIAPSSMGFVLIAVSEQLIRCILVGDDPELLVSELQNQFPNDVLAPDENYDAELLAMVVSLVEQPDRALDLRLSLRNSQPNGVAAS